MPPRAVLIAAAARDPFIPELLQVLQAEGAQVMVAHDAESTVRAIRTKQPALAVLDTVIPGGDGISLCRQIKEDPSTAGTHILFFSVLMARDRCMEAGADGFMLKPVEMEDLLAKIRELLDDRVRRIPRRAR